jgi:hypothetical protein
MAETEPAGTAGPETQFVKVWRRVGAVAVYNRGRAFGLLVALVALVAVIAAAAFFGGRASKDDAASVPAQSPAATRTATPGAPGDAPPPGATKADVKHSYNRGYRAGAKAAAPGGSSFFTPGEAYLLKIEQGRHGTPYTVGPHVRIDPGYRYRICAGGSRICVLPVEPGTAP